MAAGGSSSSSNGAASRGGRQDTPIPTGCCSSFFEYETPKVVTVQNVPLGILRLVLTCPAQAKNKYTMHTISQGLRRYRKSSEVIWN